MDDVKRYKYEDDYDDGPSLFCELADLTAADGQFFVLAADFDAQRLRADTAEAERDGTKAANNVLREELRTERLRADAAAGDENEAERKLASAEQRIAERDALIAEVLAAFKLEPDGSCINPGRDFIRPWAEKVAALSTASPATINQQGEEA